jgi:rhomboid family GlyGly-CTERM serine protease
MRSFAAQPFPWVSALLSALACIAFAFDLGGALEFDPALFGAGEIWRILTCHLTHWNASHILWDLIVFIALGIVCERADRTAYLRCIVLAAAAIGASLSILAPALTSYRGLSGIDAALFALLLIRLSRESGNPWIAATGFVLIAVKCAWEWRVGAMMFADGADVMIPVPAAHLVGAVCGAVAGLIRESRLVVFR